MVSTILSEYIILRAKDDEEISDWFTNDESINLHVALCYLMGEAHGVDIVREVEGRKKAKE